MAMDQLSGDEKEYLRWLDSWVTDPKYQHAFWWRRLDPSVREPITADMITDLDERYQAEKAIAMAKSAGSFRGKPSLIFSELAARARSEHPIRTFVIVPVRRTALTMIRMADYLDAFLLKATGCAPSITSKFLIHGVWVLILVLSLIGFVHTVLSRARTMLLAAMILGRIALPIYSGIATEPRYLIQALPCCFVFAAIGLLTVRYLKPGRFIRAEINPV
jgi:hypothetical protein